MFLRLVYPEAMSRAPLWSAREAPEPAAALVLLAPMNAVVLWAIEQNALIHSTIFATIAFVSRIG
jgi:hypothetical protein